jgi:hypothetical protein
MYRLCPIWRERGHVGPVQILVEEAAMTEWTRNEMGVWTRDLAGLTLQVTKDAADPELPWAWEVIDPIEAFRRYVLAGDEVATREEAVAAAEAAARDMARGK